MPSPAFCFHLSAGQHHHCARGPTFFHIEQKGNFPSPKREQQDTHMASLLFKAISRLQRGCNQSHHQSGNRPQRSWLLFKREPILFHQKKICSQMGYTLSFHSREGGSMVSPKLIRMKFNIEMILSSSSLTVLKPLRVMMSPRLRWWHWVFKDYKAQNATGPPRIGHNQHTQQPCPGRCFSRFEVAFG